MGIVVQKFGGTSVATPQLRERVIGHVRRALQEQHRPVVVVSAMGRAGDPYATDTLLGLARQVGTGLDGAAARELDLLLSCGEVIASSILAQTLRSEGVPARALTGAQAGVVTDGAFGNARILQVRPDRLLGLLEEGVVPVVAGYQGITADGEITTLGRGGSDTTAAALGVALKAERVEIYTDVDGMKTADPRLLPDAPTLARVSYREAMEMAHLGARVIHPRAVEIAMEGRLPVQIRSTLSDAPGTLVSDAPAWGEAPGAPPAAHPGRVEPVAGDRLVRAIAHVGQRSRVWAVPARGEFGGEEIHRLFRAVAGAGVSVDMIYVSPDRVSFIVEEELGGRVREALARLPARFEVTAGFAKVSCVGAGMHGVPGVMARITGALARAGVGIYHTVDSHANISCLVRGEQVAEAVRALYREFALNRAEGEDGGS
ncbi:aspartate kinase [Limnochorda pilosa]|uniref:Aspartokinase n=1 Tax=Limnochorda pilosa TaxID=1555112 RepID=A0A0K2SMQ9_LIMPI|nr:aspartate kinase [Limnochorda pilosa]BAS28395.1 aspartate kinase [Limnochorda pilosa]